MTKKEAGKQITQMVWAGSIDLNLFYDNLRKKLKTLNVKNRKIVSKIYNKNFEKLKINHNGQIIVTAENLNNVNLLLDNIKQVQKAWIKKHKQIMTVAHLKSEQLLNLRDNKIKDLLSRIGIKQKKVILNIDDTKKALKTIQAKQIKQIMTKWNAFIYSTYIYGITQNKKLNAFNSLFFNDNGSIKIGSSFDAYSDYSTMVAVTEARTLQQQAKAKELGLKYCWNSNPMDQKTKPACALATSAGVIPETEMIDKYGLPPRRICRCDIIYTHADWASVNAGINEAIRERQGLLINELKASPKQLTSWVTSSGTIVDVDAEKFPERAAGNKRYKDIDDYIILLETHKTPEI